jgi:hypothetical protein
MRSKPKRLDWVGGLIMVPLAVVLFVVLRLVASDVNMLLEAFAAAAGSALVVRPTRVLMARRAGALRS